VIDYKSCYFQSLNPWVTAHAVGRTASNRRKPSSIWGQLLWDLCFTKWHCDKFLAEYFVFPLSVSFLQCSSNLSSSTCCSY